MRKTIIVVSVVLAWAAHTGTTHAQTEADQVAAYNCAMTCLNQLGQACADPTAAIQCVASQPDCVGNPARITAATMYIIGANSCSNVPAHVATPQAETQQPRRRPTRTTTRTTTTRRTTTTVVTPDPVSPEADPTALTYVIPSLPILGEGPAARDGRAQIAQTLCERLGGVWYGEGRTANPSRARFVALIQNLVEPNSGPGGTPDEDRNPGVCLTPEGVILAEVIRQTMLEMRTADLTQAQQIEALREQVGDLQALRMQIEDLRREIGQVRANSLEMDHVILEHARVMVRGIYRAQRAQLCRPGQEFIEYEIGGVTERLSCTTSEVTTHSAAGSNVDAEGDEPSRQSPSSTNGDDRQGIQVPELRRSRGGRRTNEGRVGLIVETSFATSYYQLVAHAGSRSPKFFGFGLALTIRLVPHLYLLGGVDAGAGLRDGVHVPVQGQVHYRVGLLGVAAGHLLLGANAHFGHRYSGNGELAEQNGTWYQLRQRGLRLDVGYTWRERGWSPFVMVSGVIGVADHADRRLNDGAQTRFDPGLIITIGGMNLGR